MKRNNDYRKLVLNFDSSKEITKAFDKDFQKLLIIEASLESDCYIYFVKQDKTIKVGDFEYLTTITSINSVKKPSLFTFDKVETYGAFLTMLKKKIYLHKKQHNLPDSLWDEFIDGRLRIINEFLNRGMRERTL